MAGRTCVSEDCESSDLCPSVYISQDLERGGRGREGESLCGEEEDDREEGAHHGGP